MNIKKINQKRNALTKFINKINSAKKKMVKTKDGGKQYRGL